MSVSEDELIELRARAREVNERISRMTSDLDELSATIKAISVTAESADRTVMATVGHDGMLTKLELGRDVYDHHDPQELAEQIQQTIEAAVHAARQKVMAACGPFVSPEQMEAAATHDYRTLVQGLYQGGS